MFVCKKVKKVYYGKIFPGRGIIFTLKYIIR